MLHEQQKQKHSDRLEWIVIWLIAVEVVVAVVDIILKIYPVDVPCPACEACPSGILPPADTPYVPLALPAA